MSDIDELIDKRMERRMSSRQHEYFYIQGSASDSKGRMRSFLLGPYSDYEKANKIAESKRLSSYTIIPLETSDLARASQVIKARRLHSGVDISEIFNRTKHKGVGDEGI